MITPDERRAKARAWYALNRERVCASVRRYRTTHRAETAAGWRAYHAAHPELNSAWKRNWDAAHPELRVGYAAKRRALTFGNGGSHTLQEWRDKCDLLGNVCIYCGEAKPLERDHKIAISRGGTDNIDNILPACRSCNSRKSVQTVSEFLCRRAA